MMLCYSTLDTTGRRKHDCDDDMLQYLGKMSLREKGLVGILAHGTIAAKRKLGLGAKPKNGRRR